jgi:DNA primase
VTELSEVEEVLDALLDAHAYYQHQVAGSWVPDHLNRRNLYPQLGPAGIGYAPDGWATTTVALQQRGHSPATLEAAGLARRTNAGRLIDVFRDRLVIPLTNTDGRLVGFTGRRSPTAGDDIPKYLNSPTSPVFHKHQILYGLAEDTDRIRRGAMPVLVEGPLDRLAVTQGSRNLAVVAVAPCGTALTADQVAALLTLTGTRRPIAVALDPDPAGRTATLRAWQLLTQAGATHLYHVALPDGQDPADLIQQGRSDRLRAAITRHRPLALAVADHRITAAPPTSDWTDSLRLARHILELDLPHVPPSDVGTYLTHLSHRLHLHPTTLSAAAADTISHHTPA